MDEGLRRYLVEGERAGLRYLGPGAVVRNGDWVVSDGTYTREVEPLLGGRSLVKELTWGDWLPLRTLSCYYGSGTPLEHLGGPRVVVRIYRRGEGPGPSGPSGGPALLTRERGWDGGQARAEGTAGRGNGRRSPCLGSRKRAGSPGAATSDAICLF